jgi:hypothetical protein
MTRDHNAAMGLASSSGWIDACRRGRHHC